MPVDREEPAAAGVIAALIIAAVILAWAIALPQSARGRDLTRWEAKVGILLILERAVSQNLRVFQNKMADPDRLGKIRSSPHRYKHNPRHSQW